MNIKLIVFAFLYLCFGGSVYALETLQPNANDTTQNAPNAPSNAMILGQDKALGKNYFGENLFTGSFKDQPFKGFNPSYIISQGDKINLQLWGAYNFSGILTVDAKGNVFVPEVGPITLLNIKNKDLNDFVFSKVKKVFKKNVQVYASLEAAQPVKVFVTGEVKRPGLYHGYSSDSVLYYLDSAAGVKMDSGSMIDIQIKRSGETVARVNLYDFLLKGETTPLQLQNGDAIFVGKKLQSVEVLGNAKVQGVVEYKQRLSIGQLASIVNPSVNANYARITEVKAGQRSSDYQPLATLLDYQLVDGAIVEFVEDNHIKSIAVAVSGEHDGPAEYILPYGAKLNDLIVQLAYKETADKQSIQLLRKSVAQRQKVALDRSLDALQTEVMIQPTISTKEGTARVQMAGLVQNFIKEARQVQPRGQVVLANSETAGDMLLEDGDQLVIPSVTSTISVVGEVIFPTSLVFNEDKTIEDYINLAGGFANRANTDSVVVLHRDGTIDRIDDSDFDSRAGSKLRAGDEIMVMPEISLNNLEIASDVTRIIYNIAVAAAAVLSI